MWEDYFGLRQYCERIQDVKNYWNIFTSADLHLLAICNALLHFLCNKNYESQTKCTS